ncbi:50S ribosomal protein L25/general stress protein Ctc [Actinomyces qiguomingii]|uniref:50S ribosomal protein L25/general stress protein Ctc n=1 Tax=Actinomyces qiguomingii TaxID=2057800 RepID=UPI000CA00B01|nr:50S ribosomal protein L25/general stress protein Ctc [Actinomyces qiguomingii]
MPANAIALDATDRTEFGKGSSRRARRAGQVPAVVYGHGTEPRHFLLDEHATRLALRGNENALVELNVGGESLLAIAKDVQRHPIRPGVQHVDFLLVNRNEKVDVEVPIVVTGVPTPGTMHIIELSHVLVSAPAIAIPEGIDVDITGVEAGTAIHVSDLTLPEDVEAVTEADTDVVNITLEGIAAAEETPAETAQAEASAAEAE